MDYKFYFYKQYSITANVSKNGLGFGVYRHIDDIIYSGFKNIEIGCGYNLVGEGKFFIGVRSNF